MSCSGRFLFLMVVVCVCRSFAQLPDTLWTRYIEWAGGGIEVGDHLWNGYATLDGGWVVGGSVGLGSERAALIRLASNGDTVWTNDGCGTREFDLLPDGTVLAASFCGLRHLSGEGETIWERPLSCQCPPGYSCTMTGDGGCGLLAGWDYSGTPVCVIKYNAEADSQWTYRDSVSCGAGGIAGTPDGGFVIVNVRIHSGTHELTAVGLTPDGQTDWSLVLGNTDWRSVSNVFRTPQGNYIFAASTAGIGAGLKIMGVGEDGTEQFVRQYSITDGFGAASMTPDGGLLVAAWRRLIRFDREGDSLWASWVPLPAGLFEWGLGFVAQDDCGSLLVGGSALPVDWQIGDSCHVAIGRLTAEPPFLLGTIVATFENGQVTLHAVSRWEYESATVQCWRALSPEGEFTLVGTIPAAGDASNGSEYTFTDDTAEPGQTYWYFVSATNYCDQQFDFRNSMVSVTAVSASDRGQDQPTSYGLNPCYPNPFNSSTRITFTLPHPAHATVKVFDVVGREVATLLNENMKAGERSLNFDAAGLPSGIYFCRLDAGSFSQTQKMLLMR